jgi:hypothetical protein
MPNTESNLPTLSASSWLSNGTRRPNACSTTTRVPSPPVWMKRGKNCTREKIVSGDPGAAYFRSTSSVLSRNDGRLPIPADRGRKPFTVRPGPGSVDAASPREFTAGANPSTP